MQSQKKVHLPNASSRRLRNKGWNHKASLAGVCLHAQSARQEEFALSGFLNILGTGGDSLCVGGDNVRHGKEDTKKKKK